MQVDQERRGLTMKEVDKRLRSALDDFEKTVSMNRDDFNLLLQGEQVRLKAIKGTINFQSFAEVCEFRYAKNGSALSLCKNPEHEGHRTGIAACQVSVCPRMPK